MAGLEVVVRPVVFPNIRPAPPRILAPEDDPTKGLATIGGSGGQSVDLTRSWSVSVSRSVPEQEGKRQFNTERIYQKDERGNINRDNYIDVERLRKIRLEGGEDGGDLRKIIFNDPPPVDNVEVLETDITR
jgi:hypothetical protein